MIKNLLITLFITNILIGCGNSETEVEDENYETINQNGNLIFDLDNSNDLNIDDEIPPQVPAV